MSFSSLKRLLGSDGAQTDAPESLLIDGREVPVRYRGNAQARRIIMRMEKDARGVVLTVPPGTSIRAAHEFALAQSAWIWQRLAPDAPQDENIASRLEGTAILVRDVSHKIQLGIGRGVPVFIQDLPEPRMIVRGDEAHMPRRITDFLKREARADLEKASRRYADAMQLEYKQLSVRDTTTRWGSCSTTGTLSYSWRLIMAPPRVLDYVCAHEVAHIEQMNHGPKFWELVYRNCGHTDYARKWLRRNGHTLHKLPV
jgi:predicted metal-dependent hydrolase